MTPSTRKEIDAMIELVATYGAVQQPRPLDNPLIWGNYNVRQEPGNCEFSSSLGT